MNIENNQSVFRKKNIKNVCVARYLAPSIIVDSAGRAPDENGVRVDKTGQYSVVFITFVHVVLFRLRAVPSLHADHGVKITSGPCVCCRHDFKEGKQPVASARPFVY